MLLLAVAAIMFVVPYCDDNSSTTEIVDGTVLVVGEQVGIGKF